MRDVPRRIAFRFQQVEELVVPFAVEQPGARALELVAHATRAPDLHVEVFREAIHRAGNRLAQRPAAVARRHRVGHHVHGQRHHLARPLVGRAEHHRQRHGQAVIDIHLVDDGHVEFVENQALRDVPGQVRVALHVRHGARTPALVGALVAFAAADREGRDDVGIEGGGVVVVDQDHHVGLLRFLPLLRPVIAGEDRAEVIVAGLALIDRHAQQRDMAGADASGNAGHVSSLP